MLKITTNCARDRPYASAVHLYSQILSKKHSFSGSHAPALHGLGVKLGADEFALLEESIAIFHRIAVMSPAMHPACGAEIQNRPLISLNTGICHADNSVGKTWVRCMDGG